MKKYKVIALSVGADSNKVFKSGDVVNADAWADPKTAEALVEQGFLEPVEDKQADTEEGEGDELNVDSGKQARGRNPKK